MSLIMDTISAALCHTEDSLPLFSLLMSWLIMLVTSWIKLLHGSGPTKDNLLESKFKTLI